jgi:hypothetical protein
MPRTCIFCGGPANSREDVWPLWMTKHFIAPGTMESQRGPDLQVRTRPVDRPELVVRRVCEDCNNGWMSRLQSRAKPIIERLWQEPNVTLPLEDCHSLSLWAVMTVMVMQTLGEEEGWLYSEYDCTLMWNSQQMPRFTGIWIANCDGHTEISSESRFMLSGPSPQTGRLARGNAITMAFGNLALQVLKVVPEGNIDHLKDITVSQGYGDWQNIALQLWPLTGHPVAWPPPRAIRSEQQLELFTERFRSQPAPADGIGGPPATDASPESAP